MVQKSWLLAVYQACLAEVDENELTFTRRNLIKNQLNEIQKSTESKAKKPEQSLSRVLQELRDFGFVEFISNGKYKLMKKNIDIALLNSKKMSRGEKLVSRILDELNVPYKHEVTHHDLKYKGYLRFDFEINHNGRKFVIEVDGIQHYRPVNYFGGAAAFIVRKKCDQIKDDYCKKTNRTMLRIKPKELQYVNVKSRIVQMLDLVS